MAGKQKDESKYIFNMVKDFAAKDAKGRLQFLYHVGPIRVCRDAFCVTLGLSPDSSRVKKYETQVRQGKDEWEAHTREVSTVGKTKQVFARCFLMAFIMVNSEKSPCKKLLVLEPTDQAELFKEYDTYFGGVDLCAPRTLGKLWYQQLKLPVPDPVANVFYEVKMRKRAKCGFKRCDKCCELQFLVYAANGKMAKLEARENFKKHLKAVKLDRQELNRCNSCT